MTARGGRKPDEKPLVIAQDRVTLAAGLAMLARGEARGVVCITDRPGGGVAIQCFVARGPDAEARLAELHGITERAAEAGGGVLVEPARLVARGVA